MEDHFFRNLHPVLAEKEYKFQQRKSAPDGSAGECLAICLIWIKEKIKLSRFSILRTSDFKSRDSDLHNHNLQLMVRARGLGDHGSFDQLGHIEDALGLQSRPGAPATYTNKRASQGFDLEASLVGLVNELQTGTAACALMTIEGAHANHAVAMYRSRSGNLHFFDSNCGIYKVHNAEGFITSWLEGCRNRGWMGMEPAFQIGAVQNSWCQFYPRQ